MHLVVTASIFLAMGGPPDGDFTVVPAIPVSCYDGDNCTFILSLGFGVMLADQKVRLCDVDAPEIRGKQGKKGQRVADDLWARLERAKRVALHFPQRKNCRADDARRCERKNRYGRWLAYVVADEVNLNWWMLKNGDAKRYGDCGGLDFD